MFTHSASDEHGNQRGRAGVCFFVITEQALPIEVMLLAFSAASFLLLNEVVLFAQ
jgi:hypothetical protein